MGTEEENEQKREVPVSLETIANSVKVIRTLTSGIYDHVNTLLERALDIYDVINDRLTPESSGYGSHYADYFREDSE